jgi:hypothetical protein
VDAHCFACALTEIRLIPVVATSVPVDIEATIPSHSPSSAFENHLTVVEYIALMVGRQ